jgi:hypothetical protein
MKWYARLASKVLKEISSSMRTQYGTASDTQGGQRVKSKGEKRVADFLHESGIRYEYEKPIRANGRPYRPDFYLPDYGTFVEYAGMWDNFGDYRKAQYKKFEDYEKERMKLIVIFPGDLDNLDIRIKAYLSKDSTKR